MFAKLDILNKSLKIPFVYNVAINVVLVLYLKIIVERVVTTQEIMVIVVIVILIILKLNLNNKFNVKNVIISVEIVNKLLVIVQLVVITQEMIKTLACAYKDIMMKEILVQNACNATYNALGVKQIVVIAKNAEILKQILFLYVTVT